MQIKEISVWVCPKCANHVPKPDTICARCNFQYKFEPTPPTFRMYLAFLAWLGTILASIIAALIVFGSIFLIEVNAIQQTSLLALAVCVAVIPYCIARALTEISKI